MLFMLGAGRSTIPRIIHSFSHRATLPGMIPPMMQSERLARHLRRSHGHRWRVPASNKKPYGCKNTDSYPGLGMLISSERIFELMKVAPVNKVQTSCLMAGYEISNLVFILYKLI